MPNQLRAEVVSIGDELTTGQRLDTNSQWISRELALLGIPVAFHTTVNDSREDGVDAFRIAAGRADIVVATGGLGPTADDLTRDVLAAVAAVPASPEPPGPPLRGWGVSLLGVVAGCWTSLPTLTTRASITRPPDPRSGPTPGVASPISSAPWAPPAPSPACRSF